MLGVLAGAPVLGGLWVTCMTRARQPLVPLTLFRVPTLDAGIGVSIASDWGWIRLMSTHDRA